MVSNSIEPIFNCFKCHQKANAYLLESDDIVSKLLYVVKKTYDLNVYKIYVTRYSKISRSNNLTSSLLLD